MAKRKVKHQYLDNVTCGIVEYIIQRSLDLLASRWQAWKTLLVWWKEDMKVHRSHAALLAHTISVLGLVSLTGGRVFAQDADMLRYHLTLDATRCGNTEDVTGADEYYVAGAFFAVKPDGTRQAFTVISDPFDINDGQVNRNEQHLLDVDLPRGSRVYGRLRFYDEDFAKDWNKVREDFNKAADVALESAKEVKDPRVVAATGAVYAAFKVIDGISAADQDDLLGMVDVSIGDSALKPGGNLKYAVNAGKIETRQGAKTVTGEDVAAAAQDIVNNHKDFVSYYSGDVSFSKSGALEFSTWDYTQSWFTFIQDPKIDPQTGAAK
jgi:hypothetical protein